MVAVRELVTKLSFKSDTKNIERFNQSIIGFKTKFALAATAVTGFVAGVSKGLSSVSNLILDANELARSIGLSTSEVVSLQKVAEQFRISPTQFSSALSNLNNMVREAQQGFGTLQTLARDGAFEIRNADASLLSTRKILDNIIEALGKVEDEASRRDLAKQIFGNERFADLAKEGIVNINMLAESFKGLGDQIEQNQEKALVFDRSFRDFKNTGLELVQTVLPLILDAFSGLFTVLTKISNLVINSGFVQTAVKKIGDGFSGVKNFFGHDNAGLEFARQSVRNEVSNDVNNKFDVKNNINVTVPPGTEEAQAQFIKEGVDQAIDDAFKRNFETIGNNFPRAE